MSSTRQSGGRPRTSERDGQQRDENRANRHQGHHSREYREEFYRTIQTEGPNNNAHNSPKPTVPETVTPMSPAILRPAVIRHSVTGLRIPRVGSIPTTTLEMRMSAHTRRSPIPQEMSQVTENQRHGIRLNGSIVLGQSTQTTSIVDMAPPIEPYTVTGTRPTATITRAEMEERAGLGLDNTSDEDIVNLASSQESSDEQVTEGYSDDVSSVVEQVRNENEDIWFMGSLK